MKKIFSPFVSFFRRGGFLERTMDTFIGLRVVMLVFGGILTFAAIVTDGIALWVFLIFLIYLSARLFWVTLNQTTLSWITDFFVLTLIGVLWCGVLAVSSNSLFIAVTGLVIAPSLCSLFAYVVKKRTIPLRNVIFATSIFLFCAAFIAILYHD